MPRKKRTKSDNQMAHIAKLRKRKNDDDDDDQDRGGEQQPVSQ